MKEKIENILKEINPSIDYDECKTLIDDCILDSLSMFAIISELEECFNITIPTVEIIPDNFNSVEMIEKMIKKLM